MTPGSGTFQLVVNCPPVWLPMKNTRSASASALFAQLREYTPATPTLSGFLSSIAAFALSDVVTGICNFSANSTSSACAPDETTPPPATIIGRCAFASTASASRTRDGSGSGRNAGTCLNLSSTRGVRSASASPIEPPCNPLRRRCAGPGAPVVAARNAWRIKSGSRFTSSTCALNLVTASNWLKSSTSW